MKFYPCTDLCWKNLLFNNFLSELLLSLSAITQKVEAKMFRNNPEKFNKAIKRIKAFEENKETPKEIKEYCQKIIKLHQLFSTKELKEVVNNLEDFIGSNYFRM